MSYILEALTKSEQARQQVTAAPRFSLMPAMGGEVAQQRLWPYAVAGALAVNAAVLYFWMNPISSGGAPAIKVAKAARAAETPVWKELGVAPRPAPSDIPAANVAIIAPVEVIPPHPRLEPVATERIPAPSRALPVRPTNASANETQIRAITPAAPKPLAKSAKEPVVAANPAPLETSAPRKEAAIAAEPMPVLPQDLPSVSVAGFIRDDGAGGMVIVNDKLVREGDEISPGLKLEKILHDGLVFNFKGQRFKR